MHDLRIDIVEDEDYSVTEWSFNDPTGTNNMSTPNKVFNFEGAPYRGFHFSKNYGEPTIRFGAGYGLYSIDKYNGYISASMSDEDGYLEQDVTMSITLSALPTYILVNFDPAQGVMATEMTINNVPVTNTSYSMVIKLADLGITSTTLTFVFTKLNIPYNPLKITAVIPGLVSTFTDRYIQEVKFASQLLDTSFNITPTVVEQYAKITLIDRSGILTDLVSTASMSKDLKVMIYIDNILKYTYLTSVWSIQAQTSKVVLECNDPSKKLANQQIAAQGITDRSLTTLLQLAFSFTGYNYEPIDGETRTYIENFVIKGSYVTFTTSLDLLKDICMVGFFRIFWDKNVFKIARCY